MTAFTLRDFVRESNRIEGIHRDPTPAEIDAHSVFLSKPRIRVEDMEHFVDTIQPGAKLRLKRGMNVTVGMHMPPPGGAGIGFALEELLNSIDEGSSAFLVHQAYEKLHPFMDGNGRSGRVLWLWMAGSIKKAPLGFLHHWYYQSLSNWRAE